MSETGTKCCASDVLAVVEGWAEWQLLVPGAMVKEDPPTFEDQWAPVESVVPEGGKIIFKLAGSPPGVRIVAEPDAEIQVREGW